jgi:ribose 1,5-bisphosphokinase PhnN
MNLSHQLDVVSFVGPSGAGKSTAMKALASKYSVLSERYMELNRHQLDNRLMLSKWAYNQYWFDGVLQAVADGKTLLLTDRCPLDTCAYVREGRIALWEVLMQSIQELSERGVVVHKVLVTAPFDVLQARILERLKRETGRVLYNESDVAHNKRAYEFYSDNAKTWERAIDTSIIAESDLFHVFESTILDLTHNNT